MAPRATEEKMASMTTIREHAAALAAGRSTALALTEAAPEGIAAPAGEDARVFAGVYADAARAFARASDELRAVGRGRSAIDGPPISIKARFDVAGDSALAGSTVRIGGPASLRRRA